jgi:DNA polymerase elongation subunit (family B)
MLQVTMTGQLSLLMLIELFELNGIQVLQANTDGIVTQCKRSDEKLFCEIVKYWEQQTGFSTEEVRYKALFSRDVNNYIAVYETPQKGKKIKGKGVYAPTSSKKNAVNEVCIDAVTEMIVDGTPIMTTLKACTKLSKFTTMRHVRGGAVKNGEYLGKIIRWYYSSEATGEIVYARNGNKVPRSDGAHPCMDLPDTLPADIDYEWYEKETTSILRDIGFLPPEETQN